jgi:HK97 family phage major capsid protein
MDEKELKALQTSIETEQKKQTDAIEAIKKASIDQKAELEGKIAESEAKIKSLSEQADAIQLEMKDSKFGKKEEDSFAELKKLFTDKSKVEALKAKGGSMQFEIKAIMDTATNLSGSALATAVVLPMREPGIGKAPDRQPMLLDLINRGNTGSDTITWIERSARTAAAAAVAEGASYAQSDLTYIQKSLPVERLGHYFKVQNRSLDDWEMLLSEIQLEGFTGLERVIEEGVYSGTGTTPVIQGITDTGFAQAVSFGTLAGTIITPNQFDVLRAAYAQLVALHFQPSAILINPIDGAAMDMPKNVDGLYLLPNYANLGVQKNICGVPVYETTLVTAGSFLIGDFTKDTLFFRKGITVQIFDQNENDALYDRKTIVVSARCANRIKAPDCYAFVADTFANGITSLTV